MTPGQARGMLLCFALLLAGVTCNAMYLQEPRPEPRARGDDGRAAHAPVRTPPAAGRRVADGEPLGARSQAAGGDAPTLRIARFAADGAAPRPAGRASNPETVRAIQHELGARGFGPVPQDGVPGLATRAAIMAYEHDHGLPLTGAASEAFLKRLLLPSAEGQGARAGEDAPSGEAAEVIATVQRSLAELGYAPGRSDGRLGAETVRAIGEFEVDRGMVPKGRISAELVRQLAAAGAPPRD
jgi:peptidoglycan hydrolase-like protein with peptidoglycan-binding domain